MPFFIDPMYFVFLIPAMLLTLYAQWRVKSSYNKWMQVRNSRNLSGAEVAQVLLPRENLGNVGLQTTPGQLTDHYDPTTNILSLSPEVAQEPSVAAMAIAAHEIGHAEQKSQGSVWMAIRSGIVPFVGIGSSVGYIMFFAGLLLQMTSLAWLGIILFSAGMIFAIVTLPVEFDASIRGLRMLNENGLLVTAEEHSAARDMLTSAALTYVAAAAQSLLTVLYFVSVLAGRDSRRRNY